MSDHKWNYILVTDYRAAPWNGIFVRRRRLLVTRQRSTFRRVAFMGSWYTVDSLCGNFDGRCPLFSTDPPRSTVRAWRPGTPDAKYRTKFRPATRTPNGNNYNFHCWSVRRPRGKLYHGPLCAATTYGPGTTAAHAEREGIPFPTTATATATAANYVLSYVSRCRVIGRSYWFFYYFFSLVSNRTGYCYYFDPFCLFQCSRMTKIIVFLRVFEQYHNTFSFIRYLFTIIYSTRLFFKFFFIANAHISKRSHNCTLLIYHDFGARRKVLQQLYFYR